MAWNKAISTKKFRCLLMDAHSTGFQSVVEEIWEKKGDDLRKIEANEIKLDQYKADSNSAYLLVIHGSFVLTKLQNQGASLPPGMDEDQFFIQRIKTGQKDLVTALNLSKLGEVKNHLNSFGIAPVGVCLGYTGQAFVRSVSNHTGSDHFEGQLFQWENGSLLDVSRTDESGNADIAQGALGLLLSKTGVTQPDFAVQNEEDWKYKQLFEQVGKIGLVALLLILLVNYFLFQQVSKELVVEQSKTESQLLIANEIEQLKGAVSSDQLAAAKLLPSTSYGITEVGNSIAASVPKAIQLISMDINPITFSNSGRKGLEYEQGLIRVSGETTVNAALDQWLSELNQSDQFADVRLLELESNRSGVSFLVELMTQ